MNKFNEEKNETKEVDKIKEKQDDYCRNFNLLLNNMGVGKKRKTNESKKYEAKFIYKFNYLLEHDSLSKSKIEINLIILLRNFLILKHYYLKIFINKYQIRFCFWISLL